jgi:aspartyl-tRNA(Asn)/glutamyl-tRNA(Gln) amidotransferase subunit A
MNQNISLLTASETAEAVRKKKISPVEITETYLQRIELLDPILHAYITVTTELALAQAKGVERRVMKGQTDSPLLGVPVAVKDQFWTKGIRTTCGSSAYKDFVPEVDATVITRLRDAGSILLGKLHMQLGALQEDPPPFGECRNVWDPERHPGGSSTGSAVALAAHLCAASVGEDTGGSGRNPASWSGVTGLRPTYGRVSRYGNMPFCWYLDIASPMGKTVEDTALILQALSGYDPKDPYTSKRAVPNYSASLTKSIKGVRIGVIQEFFSDAVDPDVRRLINEAIHVLQGLGAKIKNISIPTVKLGGSMYLTLAFPEAATVHTAILQSQTKYPSRSVRARLWAKSLFPAHVINNALKVRALLRNDLLDAFKNVDLLLSPTTTTPAPPYYGYAERSSAGEDSEMAIADWLSYCASYALAGLPAISVPCGFTKAKHPLPVGMQLGGPPFSEEHLLQVSNIYQTSTPWHTHRAPVD